MFLKFYFSGIEKLLPLLETAHYLKTLDLAGCLKTLVKDEDSIRLIKSLENILSIEESSLETLNFRLNNISIDAKSTISKMNSNYDASIKL